jgi:signal transduction histidine kinase
VDFITKPVDFKDLKLTVEKVALQVSAILDAWNKNAELTEANRMLNEANQLKTELLSIAAHDLKNPLQSIIGFAELITESVTQMPHAETDEDLKRIVQWSERISQASQRMLSLIKDLLDTAALENGKLRITLAVADVSQITESVVMQNKDVAERKGQKIRLMLQPDCLAKVDSKRFYEVVDNLISNAIKYSPLGKIITVSCQKISRNQNGISNTYILLAVKDEGQGLTESDMTKLFGKFQRLSAQPTGGEGSTGLGLAIVKELVRLQGGRVWAESEGIGKGTTFFVELPAV